MSYGRRVDSIRTSLFSRELHPIAILAVAAVLFHGPVDVAMVVVAWEMEANPLVDVIGLAPWLAIKVVALSAAGWLAWDFLNGDDRHGEAYKAIVSGFLFNLIFVAILMIVPNFAYIVGITG